jgi:hypothetical protein
LIALPVLLGLLYVYTYGVNIAWEDQFFSMTSTFEKYYGGNLHLSDFWQQHNEHRHFLPRLVMFGLGLASGWNTKDEMWLVLALLTVNLGIILAVLLPSGRAWWRYWLAIPFAFLVFSLRQHQNLLCGFQLSFVMAATAALLTFFLLAQMQDGQRPWWKFAGAAVAATLGAVSSAHGLLLWLVGVLPLVLLHQPVRQRIKFAAVWLVIGAAEWAFYFVDYHKTVHPVSEVQERTLANCSEYFITVVGGALFPLPSLAKWLGLLLVAIAATVFGIVITRRRLPQTTFWLTVAAFGLLTQAQVAWGRTPFGSGQALSSRYATFSLFLIIGVCGALATLLAERASRVVIGLGAVLLVLIAGGIGLSYWEGLQAAAELKTRMDYHAFVFLTADSQPDGALRFAPWEKIEEIRHDLAVLKEHHLNLFSSPQRAAQWAVPSPALPVASAPPVLRITAMSYIPYVNNEVGLVFAGYALGADGKDRAGGVVVEIDGTPYRAYYGLPIGSVADVNNAELIKQVPELASVRDNPNLSECGFRREFTRQQLLPGPHSLAIKVLTADGSGWYNSRPPQRFEVPALPQ